MIWSQEELGLKKKQSVRLGLDRVLACFDLRYCFRDDRNMISDFERLILIQFEKYNHLFLVLLWFW